MGLALCHHLPRDPALRVSILIFLVSLVLQGVLVLGRSFAMRSGTVYATSKSFGYEDIVYIGTDAAVYAANGTRVCGLSANDDLISVGCARFVEGFHVVSGLFLFSFVLSLLVLIVNACCVVPLSKTTTALQAIILLVFILPIAVHTAALVIFFCLCVGHAKDIARGILGYSAKVAFRRDFLANVAIVSEVCLCVVLFLASVRVFFALLCRRSVKEHDIKKHNIGRLMQRHLVNDDWERQKEVLQLHARNVQLEMVVCGEESEGKHEGKGAGKDAAAKVAPSEKSGGFVFERSHLPSMILSEDGGLCVRHLSNEPHSYRMNELKFGE